VWGGDLSFQGGNVRTAKNHWGGGVQIPYCSLFCYYYTGISDKKAVIREEKKETKLFPLPQNKYATAKIMMHVSTIK